MKNGKPIDQKELENIKNKMIWTVVDGVIYDITNYVDQHPGGKNKILRGVSKDATIMFKKSHPGLVIEKTVLTLMAVGTLQNYTRPKEEIKEDSEPE